MSRLRAAAIAASIAALAVPLVAQPAALGAGSTNCVWHKHTKTIVKHVQRHGKRHKVVRHRHWWTCDAAGDTTTGGGGDSTVQGGSSNPPSNSTLGVTARDTPDYSYTLAKPSVPYGKVTVYFNNRGQDQHDFNIAPAGGGATVGSIGLTDPNGNASSSFNLGPGTYKLWCDLEGHDALGMHATLTVSP